MTGLVWIRRMTAVACACVLAAILLGPLPEAGQGDPKAEAQPQSQFGETAQRYEDGTLQQQASKDAQELGLLPSGDTCLMRHVNLARNADRDLRRAFALVQLARGADAARAALDDLQAQTDDQDPLVQWRLDLETARLAIRAGDVETAQNILRDLLPKQDIAPSCQADTHFLLALLSPPDQAFALLEQAARLDPVALQIQEARLAHLLRRAPEDAETSCAQLVETQIEAIVYINSLVRSDRELFRLEGMALSAPQGVMQDVFLGLLAEARNDQDAARAAFAKAMQRPPSPCAAQAQYFAARRLSAQEDPS